MLSVGSQKELSNKTKTFLFTIVINFVYKSDQLVYKSDQLVYKSDKLVYKSDQLFYKGDQLFYKGDQLVYNRNQFCLQKLPTLLKVVTDFSQPSW